MNERHALVIALNAALGRRTPWWTNIESLGDIYCINDKMHDDVFFARIEREDGEIVASQQIGPYRYKGEWHTSNGSKTVQEDTDNQ